MRPMTSQIPPPRWQPTNFTPGNLSKTPRTIIREMAKHSSKGRPTLDAKRYSRILSSPKQAMAPECARCGCKVLGHGVESTEIFYCCAHCANQEGVREVADRSERSTM